jgi:hypothetical protein
MEESMVNPTCGSCEPEIELNILEQFGGKFAKCRKCDKIHALEGEYYVMKPNFVLQGSQIIDKKTKDLIATATK